MSYEKRESQWAEARLRLSAGVTPGQEEYERDGIIAKVTHNPISQMGRIFHGQSCHSTSSSGWHAERCRLAVQRAANLEPR